MISSRLRSLALILTFSASVLWARSVLGQQSGNSSDSTSSSKNQSTTTGGAATANGSATPSTTVQQPSDDSSSVSPSGSSSDKASQSDKKYPHDGGEDDVDAIGNRKVGGRGLGDWYSYEKEIAMGKQYAQQIESGVKLIQDPAVTEYVNRIGQNLVRNSDAKVPFTIKVIDDDSINAFALPGGFFYVNSGLILAADNESEMAGVMAHEIAHVAARHATRQMTRGEMANIATIPLIFIGGGIGYAARMGASLLIPTTFMKFSRGFEAEADYLGLQYAYKTGYDPQGLLNMFEKTEALEKKKPGSLSKLFASHPQTPDRVSASEKEIANVLPPRESYIVNTSEFDDVKARLAALENRRKLDDSNKDGKRPSLRRASADSKQPGDTKSGDDRPTLKRRDDSSDNNNNNN